MFQTTPLSTICVGITNIGACGTTLNTILVNMFFFLLKTKTKTNLKRHACKQRNLFLFARNSDVYQFSATSSTLKEGVLPNENLDSNLPWTTLTDRLAQISLVPHDVGGSGDCFFKSVSHQLYETSQLHYEIRMSGIAHINNHPELSIESISNNN